LSPSSESGSIGKILRGSAWLTATSSLSKVLLLFFFIFLANRLGTEGLGRFVFLLDSALVLFVFTDLGLGYLLVQKISRGRQETQPLMARFLGLRFAMLLPATVLYVFFLIAHGWLRGSPWGVGGALAVTYFLLITVWDIFRSVVRGWERMDWEAICGLFERLLFMGVGTAVLVAGYRLKAMLLVAQGSIFCSFLLLLIWFYRNRFPIRVSFDSSRWSQLLRESLPFGLGALCIIVLYREDTLMLSWLAGDEATGIYGAAFRLMEGTLLLPQAVALAAYPTLSRIFHEGQDVRASAEKLQRWLLIFCLPLMVGGIILTPKLFSFFDTGFGSSIVVLQLLLLALPALYLNYLVGTILRSVDRQALNLKSSAVALVANFLLNLLLIPSFKEVGAAVATITTQFLYFALMYYYLRKTAGGLRLKSYLPQLIVSSAVMGIAVYLVRDLSLLVSIPVGVLCFVVLSFAVGLVKREDVMEFPDFFRGGSS